MILSKRLPTLIILNFLTFFFIGVCLAVAFRGLKPGDKVPDFQIRTVGGKEITLRNQKGKILVLAFWKRSQDFSQKVLTDLERIYKAYRDRGVTVLAINADKASESEIKGLGTTQNLSYPLASDTEFKAYGQFGVIVLPTTMILGPKGRLAYYRSIYANDFYVQVRGKVRLLLGEITPAQLERELNPRKIKVESQARKKANLHLAMARLLMTENSLKHKAREELEKAVKADPTLREAHILLARLYLKDNEVSKAGDELEEAFKLGPGSEDDRLLQGRAYASRGQDSKALSVLEGLINNDSEPPSEAYFQIGKIYEKQKKDSQAQEAYRMALELIPDK
jgi:Tfp pilus assembly protein PilF/peroxiredoxin